MWWGQLPAPLQPSLQLTVSLTAPAPKVPVPAAGPKPWSVLRRVIAQREPDWERHCGLTIPGEQSPTPSSHTAFLGELSLASLLGHIHSGQVCMCDGCFGQSGSAHYCCSPPTPHLPSPFLSLGWPGQALPRSPLASPLSASADPAARPQSGCKRFGSHYTCWPSVQQREPLRASGAWLHQPH